VIFKGLKIGFYVRLGDVLRYCSSSVSASGTSVRLSCLIGAFALLRSHFLLRGLDGEVGDPGGDVCALITRVAAL
jgi:hypothetical protein